MTALDRLPSGWEVWNDEPGGRVVLAYRPDVFDSQAFPPACLPTISVAPGTTPDQPPERRARADAWYVALYLEPAVRARDLDASFDSRDAAVAGAVDVARRFAGGEIDFRAVYQVPREAYLDELGRLVGRDG